MQKIFKVCQREQIFFIANSSPSINRTVNKDFITVDTLGLGGQQEGALQPTMVLLVPFCPNNDNEALTFLHQWRQHATPVNVNGYLFNSPSLVSPTPAFPSGRNSPKFSQT